MEERQEGGNRRPPQFRIQSGCALTYMNASSRQNLSATARTPTNGVVFAAESRGALDSWQGDTPVRPDERDKRIGA
jgi:hypothetical protein